MKKILPILIALAASGIAVAAEIEGKVHDRLERPLSGVQACLPWNPSVCALTDIEGEFVLSIPAGVRPDGAGVLRARPTGNSGPAFDLMGRRNRDVTQYGREFFRTATTAWDKPLAKRNADYLFYQIDLSKTGFRSLRETVYPSPSSNWITMATASDSGFFRNRSAEAELLATDPIGNTMTHRQYLTVCEGPERLVDTMTSTVRVHFQGGDMFTALSVDTCLASRFTGGGPGFSGTWTLVDQRVEWPASAKPQGCKSPLLYADPVAPGERFRFNFTEKTLVFEILDETCPGDEILFNIRDYIELEIGTYILEATCRHTVWSNPDGQQGRVDYKPKGGGDTTEVTWTFEDKTCTYVEPGFDPKGPPVCPDPSDLGRDAFAKCIEASGFTPASPALGKAAGRPSALWNRPPKTRTGRTPAFDPGVR
jgi:hypothetical protein